MDYSVDVGSYTTMPRRRRDRLPTTEELQEMSLERRLATLNIAQNRAPVPPPRIKRTQKRSDSYSDSMTASTPSPELYGEKSYNFDDETRYISSCDSFKRSGYKNDYNSGYQSSPRQSYHRYEIPRKESFKDTKKGQNPNSDGQPMCDIIQSSQTSRSAALRRPDILRGSVSADIRSILSETADASSRKQRSEKDRHIKKTNDLDGNKNMVYSANQVKSSSDKPARSQSKISSTKSKKSNQPMGKMPIPNSVSTPNMDPTINSNNRFMFYRPRVDALHKQHSSAIGLVGMAEDGHNSSIVKSPEGSFINPAFDIVDIPTKLETPLTQTKSKSRPKLSKPVYSTMGSSFSARPCTPSPPSHRFRNQKPPLPSPEEVPVKKAPSTPAAMKPMLSAKSLETSLKQYSSPSKLDTTDMCSPKALENMMKYYNMKDDESATPPPSKLTASKKNQSPYSSTGSLNVSGDSIDVVLRRKKKVKIRPLSFSSDDESIKRVSLEINLTPNNTETSANDDNKEGTTGNVQFSSHRKSISLSQTSLNQGSVEKLDLEDLTSTETAKLLRKQFAKLKVKASNLKVKDTELKQRFALLQNQRGRVCGHGGGITKSKIRSSPILL